MNIEMVKDQIGRKMNSYEFTPAELQFKLFGKKRCPACGGKMKSFYKEHYAGMDHWNAITTGGGAADKYVRDIYYRCLQCNKEYSLQELMQYADQEKAERKK